MLLLKINLLGSLELRGEEIPFNKAAGPGTANLKEEIWLSAWQSILYMKDFSVSCPL
jgi:hypothetical protein